MATAKLPSEDVLHHLVKVQPRADWRYRSCCHRLHTDRLQTVDVGTWVCAAVRGACLPDHAAPGSRAELPVPLRDQGVHTDVLRLFWIIDVSSLLPEHGFGRMLCRELYSKKAGSTSLPCLCCPGFGAVMFFWMRTQAHWRAARQGALNQSFASRPDVSSLVHGFLAMVSIKMLARHSLLLGAPSTAQKPPSEASRR